jgi:hypothetical protein
VYETQDNYHGNSNGQGYRAVKRKDVAEKFGWCNGQGVVYVCRLDCGRDHLSKENTTVQAMKDILRRESRDNAYPYFIKKKMNEYIEAKENPTVPMIPPVEET